jgi:hypothetical protein
MASAADKKEETTSARSGQALVSGEADLPKPFHRYHPFLPETPKATPSKYLTDGPSHRVPRPVPQLSRRGGEVPTPGSSETAGSEVVGTVQVSGERRPSGTERLSGVGDVRGGSRRRTGRKLGRGRRGRKRGRRGRARDSRVGVSLGSRGRHNGGSRVDGELLSESAI